MAETVINAGLYERKWLIDDYYKMYIRMSGLDRFMGTGTDAIIRVFNENKTDGGKEIVVPLVGQIRNGGVIGSQVLEGNETDLGTFTDVVRCSWRRNAVKISKDASYRSNFDILKLAGPELRNWAARYVLKRGLIDNIQGIVIPGTPNAADGSSTPDTVITYAASTPTQRNAHLALNSDRVLFGVDQANASSLNWATALGNVDATNDKMSTAVIDQARDMASATSDMDQAGPPIAPYMTKDGEESYVMLANRRAMRDLRRDPVMVEANKLARERGTDNPLFRNGDLMWNGVVIKEVSDMPVIPGAGAGGIDVAQSMLCGQSALSVAWGQMPRLIGDNKQDYEFRPAKAIEELIGIKKTSFAGKQFGGVTVITAATPNT